MAKLCIYLFFGLLVVVLLCGGQGRFIIENGFQSLGKMIQNFIELSTYTDPSRTSNFAQDWTIYYWAYWMVWSIAAPFFIGNISRGRTIKQINTKLCQETDTFKSMKYCISVYGTRN